MTMLRTVFRTCTLCEAMCGLKLEVEGDQILSVRGDEEDPFSHGYICPKGVAIGDVHHDPDRLRSPIKRLADGSFVPIGWAEAFNLIEQRLRAVRRNYGADAIAIYMGNPIIHNYGMLSLRASFARAVGTHNCFGPGSQDTSPRWAVSYLLYGSSLVTPVPDINRTQYFLCVGANPWVSNGSLMSAPDMRRRLRAIRERGGRMVVVDPRRTETAREADEWIAIRPGGDAGLLLAMAQTLLADGKIDERRIRKATRGWAEIRGQLAAFTPERVTVQTGIDADTIRRLAREFANASTGVVYSRIGACNNRFGTLATFATDLLNIVAGRMGEIGGAMLPTPAINVSALSPYFNDGYARWKSRVRKLPEMFGELPGTVMAEEIETDGKGQVKALITYAGNPVLSVPNGQRLAKALARLDFMVAVDLYVNETTRHADVILPPCWTMAEDHFDSFLSNFAVRNVARWCPAVFERSPDERADWEILLEIAERLGGGASGIVLIDRTIRLARKLGLRWTPKSTLDVFLRFGPHGDRYLPWSKGLSLQRLAKSPHGVDLGPLKPGISRRILHRDRRIHLASKPILQALREFEANEMARDDELLLIGRRDLRSSNSWMHNVEALVSGRERCVLLVHPRDAERVPVRDGEMAMLESRVHRGLVPVRISDEMSPGVVSLPHGWGHGEVGGWQKVAASHPGVSVNDWTDDGDVEGVVGQSILNGVPVQLKPAVVAGAES
ncbi:MAG: molybdopterin-dependent oxidoreductase [Rhodomicrobiaceae bacterium]